MSNFLSDVLNRWVHARSVSVADISDWAEEPISTIYKVMSGERDLKFASVRRLSRSASLHKGLTDLAESMLSTQFEVCPKGSNVTINHSMDDEAADGMIALSRAVEAHRAGDRLASLDAIREYEAIAGRLKAEASELPL